MLAGTALVAAAAFGYMRAVDGCLGRCGAGTRCEERRCIAQGAPKPQAVAPPSPGRRRRTHEPGLALEVVLKPGDEKVLAQGDPLGRPERIDLTTSGDEARELQQEDLDRVFRPSEPAILRCITDALGAAPLEGGKVEVGLRVERSGSVSRVRVEGPAYLQHHGLTRCVRGVVTALRFPAAGGATVVTYPFELK